MSRDTLKLAGIRTNWFEFLRVMTNEDGVKEVQVHRHMAARIVGFSSSGIDSPKGWKTAKIELLRGMLIWLFADVIAFSWFFDVFCQLSFSPSSWCSTFFACANSLTRFCFI
jgi:hypothetical protein